MCNPRPDLQRPSVESIWLDIITKDNSSILMGCMYRSPSQTASQLSYFCDSLAESLQGINLFSTRLLLTGDFNAHHTSWCHQDSISTPGEKLNTVFACFGLQQMVDFPTRWAPDSLSSSCLDILVTNKPQLVRSIDSGAPLGSSDHLTVVIRLYHSLPQQAPGITPLFPGKEVNRILPIYKFRAVPPEKWQDINKDLSCLPWHVIHQCASVNEAVAQFDNALQSVFREHLQQFRVNHHNRPSFPKSLSSSQPPWLTPELRTAVKRKRDLYSVYCKYPTATNLAAFRACRNAVKRLSWHAHRLYMRSIQSLLSSPDRPTLYQFVRQQCRASGPAAPLTMTNDDGAVVSSAKEVADILNRQFTAFGLPDDPNYPVPPLSRSPMISSPLTCVRTTTSEVKKHLHKLKCGKSPGLDSISNEVLRSLAPSIAYPLAIIFNLSYRSGVFPSSWKSAVVTALYKNKGSRSAPANYRPISLLKSISKVCERILFDVLYVHVTPALSPAQSGFRRGDSTQYQVTRLVQDIVTHRHKKDHVGIVFFDLAKAFDTVWHRGLLAKLETVFLIEGQMINWIASYLSSRSQVVRVSSVLSEPLLVTSGVPQGSILGPLLFLLYVNDLPSVVPGVSLFADDTGLICSEKSVDRLACSMQVGINAINAWMTAWQLRPNVDKTEAMFITHSPPSRVLCFPLSTTPIRIVSKHKHLGVVFDSTLCWSSHVEYVCKRTSSALGMVQPHCKHLSSTCKYLFYRCYILPIFDYCDTAWCSALSASSLNKLEVHHRLLLKIIHNKDRLFSSKSLYHVARTTPLVSRHKSHLCSLIHKIHLQKFPSHMQAYNWFLPSGRTLNNLALPPASNSLFLKSPFFSGYSYWQALPSELKTCCSIEQFNKLVLQSFKY